jgi:branched-chain amino acid transport system substrate-binding protein
LTKADLVANLLLLPNSRGAGFFPWIVAGFCETTISDKEDAIMKRTFTLGLGMALFLTSAAFAWAADEVVVGAVTPLSGKLAVYGEGFQQAMLLAQDEVNTSGGVNGKALKILFEDNTSTAQGSVSAVQKLITIHKLPVIFGPAASSNFLAVCPIAQNNRTVLIGAESAAAAISKCGSYVFRVFPSDSLQGKGVADLASGLGYHQVLLTYINNDWGVGLAEVFKEAFKGPGDEILDEFAHDEGKTDYRSEILRIKKANPPAVVNLTYIKEGATILKQAYEMKIHVQWLMGSAAKSPKLVELAGEAAEGIIGTYPTYSQETLQYKAFKEAWERKYPGKKIPIFAEYNYDMVKLTAKALNMAESFSSDAIRNALMEASKGYMGVTGDKTFDANGDVGAVYGRWTVRGGQITDYK